ncbi:hypothetical protein [Okeania sp. SIO3I5]|nr:hypothetical protein [Okeania sp. SIO3I5]
MKKQLNIDWNILFLSRGFGDQTPTYYTINFHLLQPIYDRSS